MAGEANAAFAANDGEGERTLPLRRAYLGDYYAGQCAALGWPFGAEMALVCERFRVVFRCSGADGASSADGGGEGGEGMPAEDAVGGEPQTWHYGLLARWWAEFNQPEPAELAFYRGFVERDGQPALDVGCGTGRLLLPLLREGLDVDGCDLSPDMLAHCRQRAAGDGLEPRLYQQAVHALDLPRTYRTIFMCGVFGIGGQREQDVEGLRRCYRHLAPDGTLVFSHELPYANPAQWTSWLPEERGKLPQAWPETGTRRRAADGDELELRYRQVDLDPLDQRLTIQMRALLWRAGRLVAEEEHTLQETLYFRDELLMLLAQAGFAEVAVFGGYADAPATADDTTLVFVARKDG